jgi:xanthine dehydrogenase accessory factor
MAALLPQVIEASSAASGNWLAPLRNWPLAVIRSLQTESAVVRIVIASVRGSSPREVGTCMLVERERLFGTIGGGQLEWAAIAAARGMLVDSASAAVQLHKLILGPQLAQCCGGAVELWLERYTNADVPLMNAAADAASRGPALLLASFDGERVERRVIRYPALELRTRDLIRAGTRAELVRQDNGATSLQERLDDDLPNVWLYGAGHVGQALARVLATLPLRLTWIDSRPELLPNEMAESVRMMVSSDPAATVVDAPRGTRFLVMTHSHPLDYALCQAVLERSDQPWIGVIGSKSKSARFRSRLLQEGLSREQAGRLICPIGIGGIDSKLPAVIAISVATQLLQTFEASARSSPAEPAGHDCTGGGCASCSLQPGTAK